MAVSTGDEPHLSAVSSADPQPSEQRRGRGARWISLGEVILASLVVLGAHVWHVLPNAVLLLAAMATISCRLREKNWGALGLRRPKAWTRVVWMAVGAVIVQQALGQFVVDPLTKPYLHYATGANPMQGIHDSAGLLRWLGIIWTYAAFGEELGYRGYLLNRVADAAGNSRFAYLLALLWSSALFGCAHWYQGPAGVISAATSGLVYGAAFLLSARVLWTSVCAHGLSDSLALFLTHLGVAG